MTRHRLLLSLLLLIGLAFVPAAGALLADPDGPDVPSAPAPSDQLADASSLTAEMSALPPLPMVARDAMWIGPDDYRARRAKVAAALADDGGVMVMRAYRDHNELAEIGPERQDNDSLYLTGCNLLGGQNPGAWLLMSAERTVLVMPAGLDRAAMAGMARTAVARGGFTLEQILPAPALDGVLREMLGAAGVQQVFMQHAVSEEMEFATRGRQRALRFTALADRVRAAAAANGNPELPIGDTPGTSCTHRIMKVRDLKSSAEIARLKEAARITAQAMRDVLRFVQPGIHEGEICELLRMRYRDHGAPLVAFGPIVGAGRNSLVLHYQPKRGELANETKPGDIIVIDNGCEYLGYAADFTRTICIDGEFPADQKAQVQAVLDSHLAALELARPGATIVELHRRSAASLAESYPGQNVRRLYPHLVGHHVGMHVHDPVDLRAPFQPGHVFTIEPGWYDPETGLGVRIEDTYVVTDNGEVERITRNDLIPFEPEKLGALVGSGLREWRETFGVTVRLALVPDPDAARARRIGLEVLAVDGREGGRVLPLRVGDVVLALNDVDVAGAERLTAAPRTVQNATVIRDGRRARLTRAGTTTDASDARLRQWLTDLADPALQHRQPGSNAAAYTAGWLCRQLGALKCQPIDGNASLIVRRDLPGGGRTAGIVAELPGSRPGTPVMIVVPYDTPGSNVSLTDGVNWGCPDNAALATALEVAHQLAGVAPASRRRVQFRFVSWADARRAKLDPAVGQFDDEVEVEWEIIQLNQLCPGGQLEHVIGVDAGADATVAIADRIDRALAGCHVELTGTVQPFVGPESAFNTNNCAWLDITLPAPPGQPVRPFELAADDLTPLSRVAQLVKRLVLAD